MQGLNPETRDKLASVRSVERCSDGAVLVIDSRGDSTAASAGCILATRLEKLGCRGMVIDGGFRDAPEVAALDMPAYRTRPSNPDQPDQTSCRWH